MGPVVAPSGTPVAMAEPVEFTANRPAGVPLNETAVAPVRSVPRIEIRPPALPYAGSGLTNGAKPSDRRHTVPGGPTGPNVVP